jgi:hypothetical protein
MSTQSTDNPQVLAASADVVILPGLFQFDVAPGVLFVDDERTYIIRNLTRFNVRVRFPEGSIASERDFTLGPKGAANDQHAFITTSSDEMFEYKVEIALTEAETIRATGGSDPKIVYH